MAVDAGHPVRMRAEDGLARLAEDLQFDPVMRRRIAEIRDELLDNEAMRRWIDGLWEQGRAAQRRAARDPRSAMGGKFGDALRQLGETLQQDERLRLTINRFARRAAVCFSARSGANVVRLVSDTVRSWDTRTVTQRLEDAVGRDLQYIRVNGTLVGGLVGLAIHVIETSL
jgi:uncharacterized membrane-anchored protein YjiN (DUF445 family)